MACEFNKSIKCACTASCPRHGKCCECVVHHRSQGQFPGCFFSTEGEAKHDRSWATLVGDRK
jgi:hypothetical protein